MGLKFEKYHPLVTFFYYAGTVILLLLMLHPIFLLFGLIFMLIINYMTDRLKGMRRWLLLIIISVFFMMALNPLFNERGRHVLFVLKQHRFTLEAVTYGGMNALSVIDVIILFISYNVVMTPNKILYLFSKFLPQLAVLLMLTLRFIPLMRRRMEEISLIQKSKGYSTTSGKWGTKVKTAMLYVQTLVTYSLEEAIQTADSMKARGYASGKRSSYEYYRMNRHDITAILFLLISIIPAIIGRFGGYGYLSIYPLMESWSFTGRDWQVLISYSLFLCFPIIVEAGGVFRWRILK